MKKKLIYTIAFLLSGTFLFSSCDDMLNVDSNRVEYEFDDWELSDSVYSVLGILKAVQNVGDRQILINELRADLVAVNEAKMKEELADVLLYAISFADRMGFDLDEIILDKLEKNGRKYPVELAKDSKEKYDALEDKELFSDLLGMYQYYKLKYESLKNA
jgi:hypothetical protein